ncbi:MAG: hypothetical protein BJ554DRAFT_5396 [Olpidium bornovanus]|uniref:Uncharacterized protein n=1 Tax=Olpidium bornovanus TaxID=278681 RepID=A0A8H7ZZG8_9FUNG|nr:MAG: hypothetical protein BJ554DRAFT_5396 [Olpidium bornovanus]
MEVDVDFERLRALNHSYVPLGDQRNDALQRTQKVLGIVVAYLQGVDTRDQATLFVWYINVKQILRLEQPGDIHPLLRYRKSQREPVSPPRASVFRQLWLALVSKLRDIFLEVRH